MKYASLLLIGIVVWLGAATTSAQNSDLLRTAGNGVEVNASGQVLPLSAEKSEAVAKMTASILESLPEELDRKTVLRKISLKKLDAQVKKIVDQNEFLPDTIRYFGGLTSIDYIVAVPEENDILLIGPAEGWQSDAAGNIIGKQSGLPVLVLEDFLTALRVWNKPDASTVTCSMKPSQETLTKLVRVHQQYPSVNTNNADAYAAVLEEAYGDSPITITGVLATSRYAKVLVAADFRMKRIALGLEPSQVRSIPSYIGLISAGRTNITPQFWLASEYASLSHDSKKMTWRLGDVTVRTSSRATGGMDRAALNWCRNMDENYEVLVKAQPIFGELRNNMRCALAAALIHKENLLQKGNCTLTILLDETNLKLMDYPAPKSVTCRSIKVRNGFSTVVACGGVEINPMVPLRNNVRLDNKIDAERVRLIQTSGNEWWSH